MSKLQLTSSKYKHGYYYCSHCMVWVKEEDLIRIADLPINELFSRVNRCKKRKNPDIKYNRLLHKACHRAIRATPRWVRSKTRQEIINKRI